MLVAVEMHFHRSTSSPSMTTTTAENNNPVLISSSSATKEISLSNDEWLFADLNASNDGMDFCFDLQTSTFNASEPTLPTTNTTTTTTASTTRRAGTKKQFRENSIDMSDHSEKHYSHPLPPPPTPAIRSSSSGDVKRDSVMSSSSRRRSEFSDDGTEAASHRSSEISHRSSEVSHRSSEKSAADGSSKTKKSDSQRGEKKERRRDSKLESTSSSPTKRSSRERKEEKSGESTRLSGSSRKDSRRSSTHSSPSSSGKDRSSKHDERDRSSKTEDRERSSKQHDDRDRSSRNDDSGRSSKKEDRGRGSKNEDRGRSSKQQQHEERGRSRKQELTESKTIPRGRSSSVAHQRRQSEIVSVGPVKREHFREISVGAQARRRSISVSAVQRSVNIVSPRKDLRSSLHVPEQDEIALYALYLKGPKKDTPKGKRPSVTPVRARMMQQEEEDAKSAAVPTGELARRRVSVRSRGIESPRRPMRKKELGATVDSSSSSNYDENPTVMKRAPELDITCSSSHGVNTFSATQHTAAVSSKDDACADSPSKEFSRRRAQKIVISSSKDDDSSKEASLEAESEHISTTDHHTRRRKPARVCSSSDEDQSPSRMKSSDEEGDDCTVARSSPRRRTRKSKILDSDASVSSPSKAGGIRRPSLYPADHADMRNGSPQKRYERTSSKRLGSGSEHGQPFEKSQRSPPGRPTLQRGYQSDRYLLSPTKSKFGHAHDDISVSSRNLGADSRASGSSRNLGEPRASISIKNLDDASDDVSTASSKNLDLFNARIMAQYNAESFRKRSPTAERPKLHDFLQSDHHPVNRNSGGRSVVSATVLEIKKRPSSPSPSKKKPMMQKIFGSNQTKAHDNTSVITMFETKSRPLEFDLSSAVKSSRDKQPQTQKLFRSERRVEHASDDLSISSYHERH